MVATPRQDLGLLVQGITIAHKGLQHRGCPGNKIQIVSHHFSFPDAIKIFLREGVPCLPPHYNSFTANP